MSGDVVSRPQAPMQAANSTPGIGGLVVNAQALLDRAKQLQAVMEQLMQPGIHYYSIGKKKIPDRQNPGQEVEIPNYSLGKPGAEMLCMAFGITPDITSEVLTDDPRFDHMVQIMTWADDPAGGSKRVRVMVPQKRIGYYEIKATCCIWAPNGVLLAKASGNCNSDEAAFTGQSYADCKNGILKRAEKRALVAAVLLATGASDIFTQDLEEFPQGDGPQGAARGQAASSTPNRPAGWMSEPQRKLIFAKLKEQPKDLVEFIVHAIDSWGLKDGKPFFQTIADNKPTLGAFLDDMKKRLEDHKTKQAGNPGSPAGEAAPAE